MYVVLFHNLFMRCLSFVYLILLLHSCKEKEETFKVQFKSITQSVYASGAVKSEGQYQVFPKSSGTIANIQVNEGSTVNNGTVLMTIDNKVLDYNQELSSVNAKFNTAVNNRDKLEELYQSVQMADKKLKTDSLLFARQRKLWDQGIGSQFDYEQKELSYENSKSNYRSLKLRYHQLTKQLGLIERQTTIANKITNIQSDDRFIRSQINGKVYNLLKEVGEMVSPQTPVAIVGSGDSFYIELIVDETDITKIKLGQPVYIIMESYEGRTFDARVTKIYPIMNERTKSFTVLASFVQKPPTLYPNLSVEANILISQRDKALLVPLVYLSDNNEITLKSGEKRQVKTGLRNFEMVEIIEGLKENDEVIKPNPN